MGRAATRYVGNGARVLGRGALTVAVAGVLLAVGLALLLTQAKTFFTA